VASTGLTPDHIEQEKGPEDPVRQCAPATYGINLPAIIERPLPARANKIANLRFVVLEALNKDLAREHPRALPLFKNGNGKPSRAKVIQKFLDLYNSGHLLPEIHAELKEIQRSTLYNWLQLYEQGGVDALVPQYRGCQATPITEAEKKFLLTKLLHQNQPTVGDSINKCKFLLGEASPSSPSKLRRFVNDFRKNNYDLWTLEREGQKALNDKCVPYAEREWRDLQVGEAVVADGHKLNFQVINPFTGKPCRAMMVLFWDWKSAFPLGWEIMLTESIQCVVAALRNAIITLGKFPQHALLDNGKAFRASIFTKKFRFEETEIPGIFDRLNITPHFALPYNAQSKPIERFFRTFNDWFEREMPSYTGASINDKPAYLHRNEKRAIALHGDWVPTIPEAMELVFKWREYYIAQPLRARDGQTPYDIFNAEKGPGVDPFALHFLMMAAKARTVHRNGITFNGWHWYHESLYGLKGRVIMFYSYYDLSQVYIFMIRNDGSPGEFLCVAKPIEKCKPFASEEFPEDMAAVNRISATKKKLVSTTKKMADLIQSEKQVYIDWNRSLRDRPEVAGAIRQIKDKAKPKLISYSTQKEIDDYEVKIDDQLREDVFDACFERYDCLCKKETLTDSEKEWVQQYKTGKIAPGEYNTIYGGNDAPQVHHDQERQEILYGG
jgi:putative transposase